MCSRSSIHEPKGIYGFYRSFGTCAFNRPICIVSAVSKKGRVKLELCNLKNYLKVTKRPATIYGGYHRLSMLNAPRQEKVYIMDSVEAKYFQKGLQKIITLSKLKKILRG